MPIHKNQAIGNLRANSFSFLVIGVKDILMEMGKQMIFFAVKFLLLAQQNGCAPFIFIE